jgi:hypothetical protein
MPEFTGTLALLFLFAALAGAALAALLVRARALEQLSEVRATYESKLTDLADRHAEAHKAQQATHQVALQTVEDKFNSRLNEQGKSALSVTMHPFVNTARTRGVFTRETLIEIGYKYQLLIQGLPCFEPHTVVVETTKEREVNDETIELLRTKALGFAEIAAQAKSGGLPGVAVSIARAVVSRVK